jgi:hypothetical protein
LSDFALDWLRARAPYDRAARARGLGLRFAAAVRRAPPGVTRLIDLGAGSGANFRALAPLIGGDQAWRLVERDPALGAAQAGETRRWAAAAGYGFAAAAEGFAVAAGGARWTLQWQRLDLAADLDRLDLAAADGVSTAAFLDLVSARWLTALVRRLAAARRPFLAVLSVDHRRRWAPSDLVDRAVRRGFERHQAGDKGFGPALGPAAPATLGALLAVHDYRVATGPSDWRLGPADGVMLMHLVEESAAAAAAALPAGCRAIAAWARRRRLQAAAGALGLTIGHRDVLGLPRPDGDQI